MKHGKNTLCGNCRALSGRLNHCSLGFKIRLIERVIMGSHETFAGAAEDCPRPLTNGAYIKACDERDAAAIAAGTIKRYPP